MRLPEVRRMAALVPRRLKTNVTRYRSRVQRKIVAMLTQNKANAAPSVPADARTFAATRTHLAERQLVAKLWVGRRG